MTSPPVVYFVWCDCPAGVGYVKIGTATNLGRRLAELQIGNPQRLHLLATAEGGRELEREYHARFCRFASTGEWFRYSRAICEEVRRLNGLPAKLPSASNVDPRRVYRGFTARVVG